jgi:hypothetical protein
MNDQSYSELIDIKDAFNILIHKVNELTRNLVGNKNVINRFHNVTITKKYGLISDNDGRIIKETLNEQLFWQPEIIDYANFNINERIDSYQKIVNENLIVNTLIIDSNVDCIYLCHPFGWYAYGHLFDTLQRLYALRNSSFNGPYLICSDYSRVVDFNSHIKKLGYRNDLLIPHHGYFDSIKLKSLIYTDSPANITQFTEETKEWIWERYLANVNITKGEYILFLDRGGVGSRDLENKQEIIEELSKKHVLKIFHGNENLDDALDLFYNATYIVGVHGAMFVNTIFCNEMSNIIELIPSSRVVVNMLQMNKKAKNHLGLIFKSKENHEFKVNPKILLKYMEEINGRI